MEKMTPKPTTRTTSSRTTSTRTVTPKPKPKKEVKPEPPPPPPKASDFGLPEKVLVDFDLGIYLPFRYGGLTEEDAEKISRNLRSLDSRTRILEYTTGHRETKFAVFAD